MHQPAPEQARRRTFIRNLVAAPLLLSAMPLASRAEQTPGPRLPSLKLSLNAYSFNKQLLDGSMTLDNLMEFCADQGLMAVDITGYYFKGYPEVPSDEVLYQVKRKAFALGLEISGTGVRNDFTHADPAKRAESVQLVKNWIVVAQKLGAQTVRVFSGTQKLADRSRTEVLSKMVNDLRECVEFGKAHGVVVALQNHDDFIKTAEETIEIMEAIQSPWYGLMLDIGSFRTADPYDEIARTIRYAVTWQIKEKVFVKGRESDVDAEKLMRLIATSGFRGYLPLETLGDGDPKVKVAALLSKFRGAMARI